MENTISQKPKLNKKSSRNIRIQFFILSEEENRFSFVTSNIGIDLVNVSYSKDKSFSYSNIICIYQNRRYSLLLLQCSNVQILVILDQIFYVQVWRVNTSGLLIGNPVSMQLLSFLCAMQEVSSSNPDWFQYLTIFFCESIYCEREMPCLKIVPRVNYSKLHVN